MNQQSVTDKVVIVTGAGQGLGEAIASTLGAAGAVVCACDI
jgi:NAD(P)-dependent dehydrogenase (short-subunit alcohol dehydrogenase family)